MKKRISLLLAATILVGTVASQAQQPAQPPPADVPKAEPAPPPPPPPAEQPATPEDEGLIAFKETPLQTVVETLARQAKIRLIIPEPLPGTVTLQLPGVDPKEALKLVLEAKNYVLAEGKDEIFTVQQKATEALEVEAVSLNYTTVKELSPAIKSALSSRGKLEVSGNTIIIYEVPSNMKKVRELIARLDTQTPQVLIEARLYETVRNPTKDLGIDWSSTLGGGIGRQGGVRAQLGSGNEEGTGVQSFIFGVGVGGREPIESALLTVRQFDAVLRFLNSDSDTELLATPRVVTADNREAVIKIVRQEPIPQFQFNATTAAFEISGFQYIDIGNVLKVTPRVNKDNFITMDLAPEVSNIAEFRVFQGTPSTSGEGGGSGLSAQIPVVNTRNLTTRVLMPNGDTLAIGGLIQTETVNNYSKVPVLGDVPVVGTLFRSRFLQKNKRNLLVFITPTVVPPGGKTGFEDQHGGMKQEEVYTDDVWMPRDNAKPRAWTNPPQKKMETDSERKPAQQNFEPKK